MALVISCLVVMCVAGVALGIGLAAAGKYFRVATDPRVDQILAALPGINCGVCGYAGCEGYASAVAKSAAVDLCVPGGHETALNVAAIMGVKLETERLPVRAVVHCQGGSDKCASRYEYAGVKDCRAAHLIQGGFKACEYGCLGLGTCAAVCPFGAITMGADRIPVVNWDKCTGCGLCVKACPRNLCETLPVNIPHYVACSSQDKGKAVKDVCQVGCIGCWICVKVSPEGAIEKDGNLPGLMYPPGVDYAAALEKCPMHCYVKVTPPLVTPEASRPAAQAMAVVTRS